MGSVVAPTPPLHADLAGNEAVSFLHARAFDAAKHVE